MQPNVFRSNEKFLLIFAKITERAHNPFSHLHLRTFERPGFSIGLTSESIQMRLLIDFLISSSDLPKVTKSALGVASIGKGLNCITFRVLQRDVAWRTLVVDHDSS